MTPRIVSREHYRVQNYAPARYKTQIAPLSDAGVVGYGCLFDRLLSESGRVSTPGLNGLLLVPSQRIQFVRSSRPVFSQQP